MPFVRITGPEQQRQMLQLLAEGFPDAAVDWPLVFKARSDVTGGLLLIEDGRPQGGMLSFEKTEILNGQSHRIVNLSSWYIRPPYRNLAVRMVREATADADAVYTICSPIRSVQKICLRIGFRYLSHGSIASVPLLSGAIPGGASIAPFVASGSSNHDYDRWMADHSDERFIGLAVDVGEGRVPVLWLRGLKIRGLPAARLLFATDYDALRTALPAIHWYMLMRHGIVGLYLPRIGPLASLHSVRKQHSGPTVMVKGEMDPKDVNLLYSELLYLYERS